MVFNGLLIFAVASWSADACQSISCNPERLPTAQVFHLLCCVPLQQIRRLAVCLWTVLCNPNSQFFSDSSSDDSDYASDADDYYDDSHSD
ncbi:unnamed protein product [Victoria cruziana]